MVERAPGAGSGTGTTQDASQSPATPADQADSDPRIVELTARRDALLGEAQKAGFKSGHFAEKAAAARGDARERFNDQSQEWSDLYSAKLAEAAKLNEQIGTITAERAAQAHDNHVACAGEAARGTEMPESGRYSQDPKTGIYYDQATYEKCRTNRGVESLARNPGARYQLNAPPALTKVDTRRLTAMMWHGLSAEKPSLFSPNERTSIVETLHKQENEQGRKLTEAEVNRAMMDLAATRRSQGEREGNPNRQLSAGEIGVSIQISLQARADLETPIQMGPGSALPE